MLPCRKNLRQIGLIRSTYDQSKIGSFKKLTFSLEADEESTKSSKNVDFYLWSIGKTLNSYHTFVIVWFSHFESPVLCSGPDTADTPLDYFLLAKNPYKKNVHTKKCTYTFRYINCIWSTMRVLQILYVISIKYHIKHHYAIFWQVPYILVADRNHKIL